jgi:hypothetical protein
MRTTPRAWLQAARQRQRAGGECLVLFAGETDRFASGPGQDPFDRAYVAVEVGHCAGGDGDQQRVPVPDVPGCLFPVDLLDRAGLVLFPGGAYQPHQPHVVGSAFDRRGPAGNRRPRGIRDHPTDWGVASISFGTAGAPLDATPSAADLAPTQTAMRELTACRLPVSRCRSREPAGS